MKHRFLLSIMTVAFGLALWARIRFEARVLAPFRNGSPPAGLDVGGRG